VLPVTTLLHSERLCSSVMFFQQLALYGVNARLFEVYWSILHRRYFISPCRLVFITSYLPCTRQFCIAKYGLIASHRSLSLFVCPSTKSRNGTDGEVRCRTRDAETGSMKAWLSRRPVIGRQIPDNVAHAAITRLRTIPVMSVRPALRSHPLLAARQQDPSDSRPGPVWAVINSAVRCV